jgi:hypothetical protein
MNLVRIYRRRHLQIVHIEKDSTAKSGPSCDHIEVIDVTFLSSKASNPDYLPYLRGKPFYGEFGEKRQLCRTIHLSISATLVVSFVDARLS